MFATGAFTPQCVTVGGLFLGKWPQHAIIPAAVYAAEVWALLVATELRQVVLETVVAAGTMVRRPCDYARLRAQSEGGVDNAGCLASGRSVMRFAMLWATDYSTANAHIPLNWLLLAA